MQLRVWHYDMDAGRLDIFKTLCESGYRCAQPCENQINVFMPLGDTWNIVENGNRFTISIPNRNYEREYAKVLKGYTDVALSAGCIVVSVNDKHVTFALSTVLHASHSRQQRALSAIQSQTVCIVWCLAQRMGRLNKDAVRVIAKMHFKREKEKALNERFPFSLFE